MHASLSTSLLLAWALLGACKATTAGTSATKDISVTPPNVLPLEPGESVLALPDGADTGGGLIVLSEGASEGRVLRPLALRFLSGRSERSEITTTIEAPFEAGLYESDPAVIDPMISPKPVYARRSTGRGGFFLTQVGTKGAKVELCTGAFRDACDLSFGLTDPAAPVAVLRVRGSAPDAYAHLEVATLLSTDRDDACLFYSPEGKPFSPVSTRPSPTFQELLRVLTIDDQDCGSRLFQRHVVPRIEAAVAARRSLVIKGEAVKSTVKPFSITVSFAK